MIKFTMYHSGKAGQQFNTHYRNAVTIRDAEDLQKVCQFDHVCVEFSNDFHRCNEDFSRCYAIAGDCDNDSYRVPDPAGWLEPSGVAARAPRVMFYYCASRNNNKTKHPGEPNEEGPRPRYHYYFPLKNPVTDIRQAKAIMAKLLALFPEFDDNGTKPAQFFYGHSDPEVGMVDGPLDIVDYLNSRPDTQAPEDSQDTAEPAEKPERVQVDDDDEYEYIRLNIADWLAFIPADDYGVWITVGMAIKAAGLPISWWNDFSKKSDKYPGYAAIEKKWNSFKDNGRSVGPGTLYHIAEEHGWKQDPKKCTGWKKYQNEHRQEHIAALAAVGIDCAGDPYRFTWTLDFDGSIDEVIEKATGEIVYQKSDAERAAARAAGISLRPDPGQPVTGKKVYTVPGAIEQDPEQDPAAPWEPIVKGDALPVFPLEQFPEWIRDYIVNFSENTGISKDFCAACVFGAVSSVICGKLDIHFNTTHYEPAQLYTVFVGRSGMMKSAAIKQFTGPARAWLYEKNQAVRKFNQGIENEIIKLHDGYFKAQKKGRDETTLADLRAQIEQKREEQKVEYPVSFTDVTPESLVRGLTKTNGIATINTAEGNIINVLTGRNYTQRGSAPNIDIFLNGHDGEPLHSYRVTTGEVELPRVDISLLLAIQPALLESLCRSQDANGRGLVQRFLIFAPEESDEVIDHTKPDTTDRRYALLWNDHIKRIAERFMRPNDKPHVMELDLYADRIIRECWNYEAELSRERGTDEDGISGWISKLHGKALRLAAIFALLENPDAKDITYANAEKAVSVLKNYFIPHYIGSFETMINMSNEQKSIANWILRHAKRTGNRESFTEREAYIDLRQRAAFTGKSGQENFRAALEDLQTKNFIRPLAPVKTASGRGRPARSWQINPEIYTIKIPH